MTDRTALPDPRWPRLLSVAAHELRTPITVVAGYISMLLKDRAGLLSDMQRHMLEESQKSAARLSAILAEMSDLAKMEEGEGAINRRTVDLEALLQDAAATLPPLPDPAVTVTIENEVPGATVQGDPVRLKAALRSVLFAVGRELVTDTQLLVRLRRTSDPEADRLRISVGGGERIAALDATAPEDLGTFDEWRGGCGLSLPLARRVLVAHGGCIWSPASNPKSGAVVVLPEGADSSD